MSGYQQEYRPMLTPQTDGHHDSNISHYHPHPSRADHVIESVRQFVSVYCQLWDENKYPPSQETMLTHLPNTPHCVPNIATGLPPSEPVHRPSLFDRAYGYQ